MIPLEKQVVSLRTSTAVCRQGEGSARREGKKAKALIPLEEKTRACREPPVRDAASQVAESIRGTK